MSCTAHLDPYVSKSENKDATPQQKIHDLQQIIKSIHSGMLVTRCSDGSLHSRAMAPVTPDSETQLNLLFFANNASHKFEEIQHDSHVNVSFYNSDNTSWASYAGIATIKQDRDLIKKYWSISLSAWFGDLKDGVHKGDENDPRVSLIQVEPYEIRYFIATKGAIGRAIETGVSALTRGISSPGELRTLTKEEIQLAQGLHQK
ncbi:protein bli-3 [Moniliophthora roreri MCA 2997]|uniref:Protein bli-3 n=1 Tax=Moniliophthora roreri (strain MCA 2997) TaxID=1381753 RepID=V2XBX7_MONRO|nr:protein bli-3 [Moniliophthora roreri MCA 2997]